jgi:hypothetical protein
VILRLYRARAAVADRTRLVAHVRDSIYPFNAHLEGLVSFQAGLRTVDGTTLELALLSTWSDYPAMLAGLGDDLLRPRWLAGVADRLDTAAADHFELVGAQVGGVMPLAGAVMRFVHGRLNPSRGESFFEFARDAQSAQLAAGDVVASYIGRRLEGASEEAIYVAIWRDAEAPAAAGGSATMPAGRNEWEPYLVDWTFAAYDALVQVPGRHGAPALLLADGRRRVVYATPAAARILRTPLPELLEMDLDAAIGANGGGSAAVEHRSRADLPWPGYRVAVLTPDGTEPDFAEALGASGLVARSE